MTDRRVRISVNISKETIGVGMCGVGDGGNSKTVSSTDISFRIQVLYAILISSLGICLLDILFGMSPLLHVINIK